MGEVPCTAFTDRTAPSLKGLHAARLQRNRVLFFRFLPGNGHVATGYLGKRYPCHSEQLRCASVTSVVCSKSTWCVRANWVASLST